MSSPPFLLLGSAVDLINVTAFGTQICFNASSDDNVSIEGFSVSVEILDSTQSPSSAPQVLNLTASTCLSSSHYQMEGHDINIKILVRIIRRDVTSPAGGYFFVILENGEVMQSSG